MQRLCAFWPRETRETGGPSRVPACDREHEAIDVLLDPLDGIREGWDEPIDPATAPSPAERAAAAARLARIQRLAAEPAGPEPDLGDHLVIPEAEGVLLAEARLYHPVSAAELQRARPELRFDPLEERCTRDLGPELGELRFAVWNGRVVNASLAVDGLANFAALLARLPPVLAALGGMGPIADALSKTHPAMLREVVPVRIDALRSTLHPVSLYGRRVYSSWLLGAPHHTKVALDFGIEVVDDQPSYGFTVMISAV